MKADYGNIPFPCYYGSSNHQKRCGTQCYDCIERVKKLQLEYLNKWLNRPAINKSGVAFELGLNHVQYLDVMISRGSISNAMKQKLIDGLQKEIEAAQNLQSLLKEKH